MVKRSFYLTILLLLGAMLSSIQAKEQLVIIDAVSNSKKTFIIQVGAQDGLRLGTESLFANSEVSLLSRAIEVTRYHSLWELKDKRAIFPFQKGESVTFNQNLSYIWNQLPNIEQRISRAKNEEEKFENIYGTGRSITLRGNISSTFYESTTDTDSKRAPTRSGYHIEGLYHRRLWEKFEWGVGLRFDQENAVITDPDLTLPTTRILGVAEILYHFSSFTGEPHNFFMAAGLGVGRSQTQVNEAVSTGLATVLPSLRLGYLFRRAQGMDFIIEGVAEAISAKESFIDTKEQTTNFVNAKISFGVRF